jgi:hypothetical protein
MASARNLRRTLLGCAIAASLACIWVPRRVTYYQPEQLGPYWCGYSLLWHPVDKYGPLASDDGPFLRTYSLDYLILALEGVGLTGLLIMLRLFDAKPGPETSINSAENGRPR